MCCAGIGVNEWGAERENEGRGKGLRLRATQINATPIKVIKRTSRPIGSSLHKEAVSQDSNRPRHRTIHQLIAGSQGGNDYTSSSVARWTAQRLRGSSTGATGIEPQEQGEKDVEIMERYTKPYGTLGRPRIQLPRHRPFNDEREQALMQRQLELQEEQLKQLREQIVLQHQELLQQQQETSPESDYQSPQSTPIDAFAPRPFEETLQEIQAPTDQIRYLTYLPYAGITNQFYGMLRGLEIAKALGRTLIIPPITSSSHDKSKQNQPWSKFLDLKRFSKLTGVHVVEFHELRDAERTEYHELQCHITCGFGSKRTIDFTAKGFLTQWRLNATLNMLPLDDGKLETILFTLEPFSDNKYVCVSNTYKIMVQDKSEWERFGQHLHFTSELEEFVQIFLDKNLIKSQAKVDSITSKEIVPARHRYIAIHIRRGDFAKYCEGNFAGPKMIHCLPSTDQIAERIDLIQERMNPTMDPSKTLPVFVATNERDPEELRRFANLGWRYLDHEEMGTAAALGTFGPMMVDQVLMTYAETLVGIQMSTFSRVGALRQRDWYDRQIEYM
ncbi:hypothetical protein BGZ65_000894 [Modicella reniformis]|uniref:GDP-fucose protein O-fucosyltransferase 2 n=1 Tax=Modicella reniformis TaxID=1440133 RepID=A0A9P6J9M9_9FUNG|nr:hypothetical protein BGZ65_000894 [Modicella reniformis]